MDQNNDSQPTAWFQSHITTTRRRKLPIDPVILMIVLPTLVVLLLFFFLHPLLSHLPKTIKLTSLKSTWDSLILFLVFFAILCGVFASTAEAALPLNSTVSESYEYQEKSRTNSGLRSSSRSYPDLRQESESLRGNGENRLRFTDDFGAVNNGSRRREVRTEDTYRSETVAGDVLHRPRRSEVDEVYVERRTELSRNVPESKVRLRPLPSPAPAPAPPTSVKSRRRRTSRSLGRDETVDATSRIDKVQKVSDNPKPSPPPPPPLGPSEHQLHQKPNKLEGKVIESTTELATKLDSADDQRKRKRKNKQKSINIQPVAPSIQPPPPTPPPTVLHNTLNKQRLHKNSQSVPSAPPPPPPLRSIFSALFKFGGKRKRIPSKTSPSPQPTPTTPPSSIITGFLKIGTKSKQVKSRSAVSSSPRSIDPVTLKQNSKRKSQIQPPSPPLQPKLEAHRRRPADTDKPPPPQPAKTSHSLLIPIPPSPPPFEVPAVKFQSPRDSVRLGTTHEPVPSSPDREPVDLTIDGEDSFGPSPVTFPSPDVNAKAESFISKRKYEWRMENINPVNKQWAHRPKSTTSPN